VTRHADPLAPAVRRLARRVFADESLFRPDRLAVWDATTVAPEPEPAGGGGSRGLSEEDLLASAAQDFLVVDTDIAGEWPAPEDVFPRLTWGGQLLIVTRDRARLDQVAQRYARHDCFDLETPPARVGRGVKLWAPRRHYALIRRVTLLAPGQHTDRSTFDVRLVRDERLGPGYVVRKQVPTHRRVGARLHERFPDATADLLLSLQVLAKELPPEYRDRVPRALGMEKAADGTVKRLYMTWLRMDRAPMKQLEFALQATELLAAVHDVAKVIHLDLLHSLFEEMMNTSQIQRTMGRMKDTGRLTSDVLLSAHGKMDRAVDMFYLSLQITHPVSNPELRHLIQYEKGGPVATAIKGLVAEILRPPNPERPRFISAADVHRGLASLAAGEKDGRRGGRRRGRQPAAAAG